MGKSTISTGPFSIAMLVHQRVNHKIIYRAMRSSFSHHPFYHVLERFPWIKPWDVWVGDALCGHSSMLFSGLVKRDIEPGLKFQQVQSWGRWEGTRAMTGAMELTNNPWPWRDCPAKQPPSDSSWSHDACVSRFTFGSNSGIDSSQKLHENI